MINYECSKCGKVFTENNIIMKFLAEVYLVPFCKKCYKNIKDIK